MTVRPADAMALVRPRFRGWLHEICFFLSLPAGFVLVLATSDGEARLAAGIYALGLSLLYGVSAAYHRITWSPAARSRMKRLDHGVIFVMIAGTYTPMCLLVLSGTWSTTFLVTVWVLAAAGLALAIGGIATRPGVGHTLYLTMGWLAVLILPQIARRLSGPEVALLIAGGVVYTVGAFVLAARRPNPFPATFGYHEVWHAMVVSASFCHYLLIFFVVRAA